MSIDRETRKEGVVPIETENGVVKHTHNGVDSPRIKFIDIEKVVTTTEDISLTLNSTSFPGVGLISLDGDYNNDWVSIENKLNAISGHIDTLKSNLDEYQESQKDVVQNLADNGLITYE